MITCVDHIIENVKSDCRKGEKISKEKIISLICRTMEEFIFKPSPEYVSEVLSKKILELKP